MTFPDILTSGSTVYPLSTNFWRAGKGRRPEGRENLRFGTDFPGRLAMAVPHCGTAIIPIPLKLKTYLQLKLALARLCGDIAKRVAAVDIQVRICGLGVVQNVCCIHPEIQFLTF